MRLYLDDDTCAAVVIRLLRNAGHDVQIPSDVGLTGADDPVHLTQAVDDDRICVSQNYRHFENLHNLIMATKGHHPGIWVVRRDNNPKRDLTPTGIVRAIAKLLAAAVPIGDQFVVLNHWR